MSDPKNGPPIARKTTACAASVALFLGAHSLFASVLVADITTQSDVDRPWSFALLQIRGPRDGKLLVGSESWVEGNTGRVQETLVLFLSSFHVKGEGSLGDQSDLR